MRNTLDKENLATHAVGPGFHAAPICSTRMLDCNDSTPPHVSGRFSENMGDSDEGMLLMCVANVS